MKVRGNETDEVRFDLVDEQLSVHVRGDVFIGKLRY
jgi:hypothetical protein